MTKTTKRRAIFLTTLLLLAVPVALLLTNWWIIRQARAHLVTDLAKLPVNDVAIVLGTSKRIDGTRLRNPFFERRMKTAAQLYHAGKVRHLLVSGDNSTKNYDEPTWMRDALIGLGVPASAITLDYAGFRTLDSCVRIRKVFGQTRIYVVSQRFHLPRAVHLCRWAGVDAIGIVARDPRGASSRLKSTVREVPASAIAWAEAHIFGRGPKYLGNNIDIDNPPAVALEQPGAG